MGQGSLSLARNCAITLVEFVFQAEFAAETTTRAPADEGTKLEDMQPSSSSSISTLAAPATREPSKRTVGRRKAGGKKAAAGAKGGRKGVKDTPPNSPAPAEEPEIVPMETEDHLTGETNFATVC